MNNQKIAFFFLIQFSFHAYTSPEIFKSFKPIETARLIIRKLEISDAKDCLEFLSDIRVVSKNGTLFLHNSIQEVEKSIVIIQQCLPQFAQLFAIEEKSLKKVIGLIGFDDYSQQNFRSGITYALTYKYWNKGYAFEAAKVITQFGFEQLHLNRLYALIDPENINSIRIAEKLGMKLEGILRKNICINNTFFDRKIYSLLKHEWDNLNE